MKIVLAHPHGFCAGVVRAIDIVERALTKYARVYVRHEVVPIAMSSNRSRRKGRVSLRIWMRSLRSDDDFQRPWRAPRSSTRAKLRSLPTIDATCPLVAKVHIQGRRYIAAGAQGLSLSNRFV